MIRIFRQSSVFIVSLPLVLLAPSSLLHSQNIDVLPESILHRAEIEYSRSSFDTALRDYQELLHGNESSIPALMGAGRCSIGLGDWGDGAGYFEKVLELDTASMGGHYSLGVCRRENGKTKAWLLRIADWNASTRNFQWVVSHDSLYLDVLYQYALLLNCKDEFANAITMGMTQVRLKPDLVQGRLGLWKLYRSFVVNDRGASIRWLRVQPGTSPLFFLGEAYRRDNNLDAASEVFRRLLNPPAQGLVTPAYLSLARIAAKQSRPGEAEENFWAAVEAIREPYDADIVFEDVKYLVSDPELKLYRSLSRSREKIDFFQGLWTARNPSPGMGSNPRIAEHYRRLVVAEENYEYYGFRTQFTNPDQFKQLQFPLSYSLNQEFNDMGLIYIRHGPPDGMLRGDNGTPDPNESWLYSGGSDSPKMIFHFIRKNSVGNNWRLAPVPENRSLLSDLAVWDPEYLELLKDDPGRKVKITDEVVAQSRATVETALSTEKHQWAAGTTTFEVPYSIDTFRGKGAKALVDISYAIPLPAISAGWADRQQSLRVVIGLAFHALDHGSEFSSLDTILFPASSSMSGSYLGLYRFYIPADKYSLSMQVRPLGTSLVGHWSATATVPDYSHDEFSLSDLEFLVPSEEKTAIEIEGIKVTPSPFDALRQDQPLYLFERIYNLVKDADGNTRYAANYVLTPVQAGGEAEPLSEEGSEDPGDRRILNKVERDGHEVDASEFQKIDLTEIKPGTYRLSASVTDRKRVKTLTRSRIIEIESP